MAEQQIPFEQAFKELEEVVGKLEAGTLALEESLGLFERGMELAKLCSDQLDKAELRVRQLVPGPDGDLVSTPFEDWEAEALAGLSY